MTRDAGVFFLFISTNFVITPTTRSPGPVLDPHPCVSTYHHPFTPTTTQFGPTTTRLHPPTPILDPFTPTTTRLHPPTLLFEPYSPVYTYPHTFWTPHSHVSTHAHSISNPSTHFRTPPTQFRPVSNPSQHISLNPNHTFWTPGLIQAYSTHQARNINPASPSPTSNY